MLLSKSLHATAPNSHWEMFHLLFQFSLDVGHHTSCSFLPCCHSTSQQCKCKIYTQNRRQPVSQSARRLLCAAHLLCTVTCTNWKHWITLLHTTL